MAIWRMWGIGLMALTWSREWWALHGGESRLPHPPQLYFVVPLVALVAAWIAAICCSNVKSPLLKYRYLLRPFICSTNALLNACQYILRYAAKTPFYMPLNMLRIARRYPLFICLCICPSLSESNIGGAADFWPILAYLSTSKAREATDFFGLFMRKIMYPMRLVRFSSLARHCREAPFCATSCFFPQQITPVTPSKSL